MRIRSPGGVICCGNICLDIPVWPVEQFHWGTTTWVEQIERNIGGNGGNTSTALARLGTPVRLYGVVGKDADGESLLEHLRSDGVDVGRIGRSEKPNNSTVCLVHSSGDRLFLHMPGASGDVDPEVIRFNDGPPYSHFHFANPFVLPMARLHGADLMQRARAAGLTTSLDTGWDAQGRWNLDIDPCLPFTDLLFVNGSEAKMLTGQDDPDAAAQVLLDKGAGEVVIKLGGRGSVVYAGRDRIAAPAFEIAVKDTTGAGDCFAAGFLSALRRGLDYRSAARVANAVGAMSVESLGAVSGVRTWNETMDWIAAARVAT